tara:strand:+ start:1730 stop:1984 length:255 start_codon:yes stop_codon:yes gene_type:complete
VPKPLDFNRLKQFEVRSEAELGPKQAVKAEDVQTRWPSREPVMDGQISIKAPIDSLARFKQLCKDDRRTYADMLRILMDRYEEK